VDCIAASSAGETSVTEIQLDDGATAAADESVTRSTEACLDGLELEVLGSPCAVSDFHAVIGEPHAGKPWIAQANVWQGDCSIIARNLQIIDADRR